MERSTFIPLERRMLAADVILRTAIVNTVPELWPGDKKELTIPLRSQLSNGSDVLFYQRHLEDAGLEIDNVITSQASINLRLRISPFVQALIGIKMYDGRAVYDQMKDIEFLGIEQ